MVKSLNIKVELSVDDFKSSIISLVNIPLENEDETLTNPEIDELIDDWAIDQIRYKWSIVKDEN